MEVEIPQNENIQISNLTNTQIDIFQIEQSFALRPQEYIPFVDSYEQRQLENEATKLVLNYNNLVFKTICDGEFSMKKTEFDLKKTFRQNINNEISIEELEKLRIIKIRKNLENDPEFRALNDLINTPNFNQIMRSNPNILNNVLNHQYLKYHPKYEEIIKEYKKVLCPNYNIEDDANQNEANDHDLSDMSIVSDENNPNDSS